MNDPTRPSLILRVRDPADVEAWREFDETYRALILGCCHRRGLQFADAEDVRQNVLAALSKSFQGFTYDRSLGRFRDYLGRAVHHAISRHIESRGRREEQPLDSIGDLTAESEFTKLWEKEWIQHHLGLAMAKLRKRMDPQHLDVFDALLEGQAPAEIAERYGLNVHVVYKIKQRTRENLEMEIEQQTTELEFPERRTE